jgi:putative membrane protein
MMTGFGLGFGIFGIIFMVVFWGSLIAIGIWLVKSLFAGSQSYSSTSLGVELTACRILDQRYARGEITREQYELMKTDLE